MRVRPQSTPGWIRRPSQNENNLDGIDYRVSPPACEPCIGSKAYRFHKLTADDKVYDLHLSQYGWACDCPGPTHHGHCKHAEAVKKLCLIFHPPAGEPALEANKTTPFQPSLRPPVPNRRAFPEHSNQEVIMLEAWKKVWREGIAPELTTAGLEALAAALESDSPELLQGVTTSPPPLQCMANEPVLAACPIGLAAWKGEGRSTAGEVEELSLACVWPPTLPSANRPVCVTS